MDESTPTPTTDAAATPAAPSAVALDFVEVYRTHFAFVWRSLRRLGMPDSALDDAAQEVFIVVHRRLTEFEGRASLKTWIFGILLNTVRHHRRAQSRRRDRDPLPESMVDTRTPGPLERAATSQAAALLHRFLDHLDDAHREVFVLSELEQMTAPEVAAATGANVNTVQSRIRNARQQFEQMVARERARDPWGRP